MIQLVSFGKKNTRPERRPVTTRLIDCTHLPNPYFLPWAKTLTGVNPRVQEYVLRGEDYEALRDNALGHMKDGQTWAFFCMGGQHRSVAVVEELARILREKQYEVSVQHLSLERQTVLA